MLLYDARVSGNCYKVRLLLAHLGFAYGRVELGVMDRSNRRAQLSDKNPDLRIPVLVLDDGRALAESNAILFYLAEGTPYLPADRFERAQVLQWSFYEQYSLEPNLAVARFWVSILGKYEPQRLAEKQLAGTQSLAAMESHLATRDFFVAQRYTIADIALYAYTHVAREGGFDLDRFPSVLAWLGRVASQPGHVTIDS